ncbi:MAG: RsmD family RNA methyltransferase [Phycisphaerae bacterium]|jgi:16S rRNA (guanine(966)-N(2))-methyltransferase RsmD
MRIIAGEFRRRLLNTPRDASVTRPIPDRVKESLFSILRGHCEGASVFDGFSGTGAIGLEAVSRGAQRCLLVERDRHIVEILRSNVELLGCGDRCTVLQGDALGAAALAAAPRPLTLAFLDPPYPLVEEIAGFRRVMAQVSSLVDILAPGGFVVLRTPWPLRHSPDAAAAAAAAAGAAEPERDVSRKDKRGQVKRERSWRRHAESMDPKRAAEQLGGRRAAKGQDDDEEEVVEERAAASPLTPAQQEAIKQLDRKLAQAESEIEQATPVKGVDADLTLPNAVGPETHLYHGMAIHLYAKR